MTQTTKRNRSLNQHPGQAGPMHLWMAVYLVNTFSGPALPCFMMSVPAVATSSLMKEIYQTYRRKLNRLWTEMEFQVPTLLMV